MCAASITKGPEGKFQWMCNLSSWCKFALSLEHPSNYKTPTCVSLSPATPYSLYLAAA